jgi:glyceraldehyde-3-phosphate dehydrogenase (NADP+)
MTYPLYVDGRWITTSRSRAVTNPFTGDVVHSVCQASPDVLELAIDAAARAFEATRRQPAYERASVLDRAASGIEERKEELARIITLETGKPIAYSRAETDRAIFTFKTSAEEARRIGGELLPLDISPSGGRRKALVRRFPLGPVAAITPFNFPLNLVAHKVGPAIAAGNTFVLKPSSNAPRVALRLGEILEEAGCIKGACNIVPCASDDAGQLVTNERIKLLTFTGSPAVGWPLKSAAGKKRVVLELGGNAGVVVDRSADLDAAVPRLVAGSFANAGQSCIAVQRIFVHSAVYDRFVERFLEAARGIQAGDPEDEKTVVGPMITEEAAAKVQAWVDEAVRSGGKLLAGGTRQGAVMQATVLAGVDPGLSICSQEVFAPVVIIDKFMDFREAVRNVNRSDFGLQAAVFTNNLKHVTYAYEHLEVGGVIVNDASTYRMDHMPYGGVKDSGFGREGVRYAIEEMTEMKLLSLPLA